MNNVMQSTSPAHAPASLGSRLRDKLERRPEFFTLFLLIALSAFVGTVNPSFFQISTLFDIARSSTVIGLFALGVFVILAAGGIDVSFTAIAALSMYAVTKLVVVYQPDTPILLVFALSTVGGGLLGLVNGVLVQSLKAPSLIVTIGTQYLFRGLLLTFVGTVWIIDLPAQMDGFGKMALLTLQTDRGNTIILPAFVLILLATALLTWWILNRTLLGKAVFAVGGSPVIAERLGYNLRAVHFFIFSYTGALAGLAGMI
ncbi:MAG: ABC transporter permease, partial [Moraxellaceae bacterium]